MAGRVRSVKGPAHLRSPPSTGCAPLITVGPAAGQAPPIKGHIPQGAEAPDDLVRRNEAALASARRSTRYRDENPVGSRYRRDDLGRQQSGDGTSVAILEGVDHVNRDPIEHQRVPNRVARSRALRAVCRSDWPGMGAPLAAGFASIGSNQRCGTVGTDVCARNCASAAAPRPDKLQDLRQHPLTMTGTMYLAGGEACHNGAGRQRPRNA